MNFIEAYNHHNGQMEWQKRDLFEWLTDVFEAPGVEIIRGATSSIRGHVREQFDEQGWSGEAGIDPNHDLTIFSMKGDLAFQIQTGNISRAFYDLLKLQYLYVAKKINAAALAVPSSYAATTLGSNIASYERLCKELQLFSRVISVPLLLISFE